ncbi:MAG: energy transducer TonB [Lysobacterales bacterium]
MIASRSRRLSAALLSMVIGLLLVSTSIIWMNRKLDLKGGESGTAISQIVAEKKEKPKPKREVQKREPPKRQPKRAPAPPSANLGSALAGLDFGLPQYESEDLSALGGNLLGDGKDVVMTDSSVDVPPRPMVQSAIPYPLRAKAQGVEGYVLLSVLISPTGQVERVKVLESQPAGVFEAAAEAGVKSWKFEPAQYQGQAVRVWATQRVRFDLS